MIKAIVYGYDRYDSERLTRENNLKPREVLLINGNMSQRDIQEKIRGYYNDVMQDRIKLINISKKNFRLFVQYFLKYPCHETRHG